MRSGSSLDSGCGSRLGLDSLGRRRSYRIRGGRRIALLLLLSRCICTVRVRSGGPRLRRRSLGRVGQGGGLGCARSPAGRGSRLRRWRGGLSYLSGLTRCCILSGRGIVLSACRGTGRCRRSWGGGLGRWCRSVRRCRHKRADRKRREVVLSARDTLRAGSVIGTRGRVLADRCGTAIDAIRHGAVGLLLSGCDRPVA